MNLQVYVLIALKEHIITRQLMPVYHVQKRCITINKEITVFIVNKELTIIILLVFVPNAPREHIIKIQLKSVFLARTDHFMIIKDSIV